MKAISDLRCVWGPSLIVALWALFAAFVCAVATAIPFFGLNWTPINAVGALVLATVARVLFAGEELTGLWRHVFGLKPQVGDR